MTPRKTFHKLSKEKQDRITRVAVEEFSTKGFDGASINAMVERLNIAKGSIFQYFGDKKGLFLFVFNRSVDMVKDYLKTIRDQSTDDDLSERLTKTLSSGVRFIRKHPLLYRLYIKVLFESKAPFRDEILLSLRQHSIEYIKSLLDTADIKGELKGNIDLNKAAFVLDAVMDRFLQAHTIKYLDAQLGVYQSDTAETDRWIHEIVDVICQGVKKNNIVDPKMTSAKISSSKYPYILIAAATDEELSGLQNTLANPIKNSVGGKKIVSGSVNNIEIKLLTTGPGMVNTTQALTACIERDPPAMIIQTGCAGAFPQSGLRVGDLAIATEEIDLHLGLEPSAGGLIPDPLPFAVILKKNKKYKNRYPASNILAKQAYKIIRSAYNRSLVQVKKGPFLTVGTITATDETARKLFVRFQPCMEQMEGAGAAYIALLYDLPYLEIRSASNLVGNRDTDKWDLSLAFQNSCNAVFSFVQSVNNEALKNYIDS